MHSYLCLLLSLLLFHAQFYRKLALAEERDDGTEKWGYVEVRPKAHMFWWLYRSPHRADSASSPWPIMLWLDCGEGGSRTGGGNFQAVGPLDMNLKPRNWTWLHKADLLFVDNPVGAGFSYVEDERLVVRTDEEAATDLTTLLKELFNKDKRLQTSPLFIVGGSYGGRFAVTLAVSVLKAIQSRELKLRLGGVALGESWISPEDLSWGPLLEDVPRLDDNGLKESNSLAQSIKQQIQKGLYNDASDSWFKPKDVITARSNSVDLNDVLLEGNWSNPHSMKAMGLLEGISMKQYSNCQSSKNFSSGELSSLMNGVIREKLKIIPKNVTWGGQDLVVCSGLTNVFKKPRINEKDLNPALVLTVDPTGKGNFTTIQAAVNASPDNAVGRTVIRIAAAYYWEKVIVSVSKTNLTFQGQGLINTIIAWNDTAGNTPNTYTSPSVAVFGNGFRAYNISFKNTAPPPSPGDKDKQAVALRIGGDAAAFFGCGFYGVQDTLLDDTGRHYFKDCFIEGSIDFIFGHARSLYEDCKIHLIAKEVPGMITGSITAQERKSIADKAGFSFLNCTINGTGLVWLGRALSNYSLVVFIRTFMPVNIAPAGWDDQNQHYRDTSIFFGEYECQGPGASNSSRVGYYKGLNHTEAAPFMNISFIDGDDWLYH